MNQTNVFKITYWGTTGTFSDPLRPEEVTRKIERAVMGLVEKGGLQKLQPGADHEETIRKLILRELPFHLRSSYGGNTTCVEVQTPDALIILDAGSGLRELGLDLAQRWDSEGASADRRGHLFLSHAHMDHTFATPYFDPYYHPANSFFLYGPPTALESISSVLDPQSPLSNVFFPTTLAKMPGLREFRPLLPGADFLIGTTRITTHALNHPGGALAYRLENSGRSFVFATDHEHRTVPDLALAEFAADADLFYTEGQYTQAEYDGRDGIGTSSALSRRGWGHSPRSACVHTALAARVRRLHVGHRDPCRDDREISLFSERLRELARNEMLRLQRAPESCEVTVPYEGMSIQL